MKQWFEAAALGVLLWGGVALARAEPAAPGLECFDVGGQAQARTCLEARFAATEQERQQAEQATAAALQHWDEWPSNKQRARQAWRASARQFVRYRQAQCDLQAALAAGGTGTGHRRLLCEIALNLQRVAALAEVRRVVRPEG